MYHTATNAFYHTSVHADIPSDAVAITDDLHTALLTGQEQGLCIMSPDPAHPDPWLAMPEPEPPSLEDANSKKYAEILSGANTMDAAIKARYSTPEIASFEQQRVGAEAILADNNVLGTPGSPVALVRGLAAAEGVSAVDFAERILHNVRQASAALEAILLQQRAYEAALKKAATTEEVEAITVKYALG